MWRARCVAGSVCGEFTSTTVVTTGQALAAGTPSVCVWGGGVTPRDWVYTPRQWLHSECWCSLTISLRRLIKLCFRPDECDNS